MKERERMRPYLSLAASTCFICSFSLLHSSPNLLITPSSRALSHSLISFVSLSNYLQISLVSLTLSPLLVSLSHFLLSACLSLSHQGSTLAMCPLDRMHFLGHRASSGHNNSFYTGPRGQWVKKKFFFF